MRKRLLLLSFFEGAGVMCAELAGARLLAPLFGSSLYVWACVMGITLAGLALGYFLGGSLSTGQNAQKRLYWLLFAAGAYLIILPNVQAPILPLLEHLGFFAGLISSTAMLIFVPILLLGATGPLFIKLQTGSPDQAGRTGGVVFAVSTAGGILSTFLCGFYLIPEFGLSNTLLLHGLVLLTGLLATVAVNRFISAALLLIGCATLFQSPASRALYAEDGIQGRVEVIDEPRRTGTVRQLVLNGIVQSELNLRNKESDVPYVKVIDSISGANEHRGYALVLGLGAGIICDQLVKQGYSVKAVEFDKRIIKVARNYFDLDPAIQVFESDGRFFVNQEKSKYDLIVIDLFMAEELPAHVLSVEGLSATRALLNSGGQMLINWHGYMSGETGQGSRILINTLHAAGFNVKFMSTGGQEAYSNLVFNCSPAKSEMDSGVEVNTDNQPKLERYNALANLAWRRSYLAHNFATGQ